MRVVIQDIEGEDLFFLMLALEKVEFSNKKELFERFNEWLMEGKFDWEVIKKEIEIIRKDWKVQRKKQNEVTLPHSSQR